MINAIILAVQHNVLKLLSVVFVVNVPLICLVMLQPSFSRSALVELQCSGLNPLLCAERHCPPGDPLPGAIACSSDQHLNIVIPRGRRVSAHVSSCKHIIFNP